MKVTLTWKSLRRLGIIGLIAWFVTLTRVLYEMIVHWPWYLELKYHAMYHAVEGNHWVLPDHPILNAGLLYRSIITGIGLLSTCVLGWCVMRMVSRSGFNWDQGIFRVFAWFASIGVFNFLYYSYEGLWATPMFHILTSYMLYGGK